MLRVVPTVFGACLSIALCCRSAVASDGVSKTVSFPEPDVGLTSEGLTRVSMSGCFLDVQTGVPALPAAGVSFELDSAFEVGTVTITPGHVQEIPIDAAVEWGQPPNRPFDDAAPKVPPDAAIYQGQQPYPDYGHPAWRVDPTDGKLLVTVQLHPVRFDPVRRLLLVADSLTVTVSPKQAPAGGLPVRLALAPSPTSPLTSSGPHTYVVISTSNLIYTAQGPWNLQALCAARARAGFTPELVTTEWIQSNYPGTNLAIRIRAFVQDAYANWGTRYLLLAGTFDLLPVQKLYVSFADFLTTQTAYIPSDAIYYGCVSGTLDGNGNGRYGEVTDGASGGDVDLTAEVMVGRFPVANTTELSHMVRKTLRYESASAQEIRPAAHIAEIVNLGTTVYGAPFMEELRRGSSSYGLTSIGFENSPYADTFDTDKTLYDSSNLTWTASDALAFLNQNLYCVNHLGHGASQVCFKMSLAQSSNKAALAALTNALPYFVYSQACSVGAFDTADCFAEQIVTASNAAVAAVMNARDGWEFNGVIGGYSQYYHRCFWDAALRGKATRLGEISDCARRMCLPMLGSYSANYWRWIYYELNLFGDPATPFAAAVNTVPAAIAHEPLINTYDTQTAYRVTCTLEPIGIFDPDSVSLVWWTDRAPGTVHTQSMAQVSGNLFDASIAPQEANTRVEYAFRARNHAGVETRSPADSNNVFYVTDRLSLTILGSPVPYGIPTPNYGVCYFASGLVATAAAPDRVYLSEDTREANVGFFGTGSAPQHGTNLTVSFQTDTSSLLAWMWQREYRLTVGTDLDGSAEQTYWFKQNETADVPTAAALIQSTNGTGYAFAEWFLDGVRAPALPQRSGPAFGGLAMGAPHALVAHYLPADLDADANGIPDWWETQYYGANGQNPASDEDSDGFTLTDEYLDRTNPRNTASTPQPPVIVHTPLDETQTHPGPFTISATITDSFEVASAVVQWHRKTEAWQSTPMQSLSNGVFVAQIGSASAPGDDFEYLIEAVDPTGRVSQTDVFFFFLWYPVADYSRFHDLTLVVLPTSSVVSATMNLFNTGNADLIWSTRWSRVESILDPTLRCWNRVSIDQSWAVSTNRFSSAPYALHSQLVSAGTSGSPAVHATIALPPLLIGPNATLSFRYWINSELYSSASSSAYDGGIVEFSTDNGATFQQLRGPYTHTIHGWLYSPWTNGTSCFAGNGTEGWRTATFDLAKEYPEENGFLDRPLLFRFHYGGDNNTDKEGWYIDDVTVSPLLSQTGFANTIEPTYNYTVPGGNFKRITWYNSPPAMDVRDDNLSVSILSNDPVNPVHTFFWSIKIRDYPIVTNLGATQTSVGDGLVNIAAEIADCDGEPVSLTVDRSQDNGKTWLTTALTNVVVSTGTVASASSEGAISNLLTAGNNALLTNDFAAVWDSRAAPSPVSVCTQTLVRVTATNGYFGKHFTTARFTVDNVPPVFEPGALTALPHSSVGAYALTTNLLTLTWPAATDNPSTHLSYRLVSQAETAEPQPFTNATSQTSATLSLASALDLTHAFSVVAYDPAGNASDALTLSLPVLNALNDFDGDGMTTADEEIAGTSAVNAASRFAAGLATESGGPVLSWPSAPDRLYTVESTASLLPPAWQPLPDYIDMSGTGEVMTIHLPIEEPTQFFRIRVRLP